jgi:hypothetical protein
VTADEAGQTRILPGGVVILRSKATKDLGSWRENFRASSPHEPGPFAEPALSPFAALRVNSAEGFRVTTPQYPAFIRGHCAVALPAFIRGRAWQLYPASARHDGRRQRWGATAEAPHLPGALRVAVHTLPRHVVGART